MSRIESLTIREVESSDLEPFYEQQLDPEAIRMAAFVCKDPKDNAAFDAHWDKILRSSQIIQRTIVAEGQVTGHIACTEFWGRGLATESAQSDPSPRGSSAAFRQGRNGQHRVDKSATEMRF